MKIKMILAMDENNTIGIDGDLPWKLKSDMKRFRGINTGDGFNCRNGSKDMGFHTRETSAVAFR